MKSADMRIEKSMKSAVDLLIFRLRQVREELNGFSNKINNAQITLDNLKVSNNYIRNEETEISQAISILNAHQIGINNDNQS